MRTGKGRNSNVETALISDLFNRWNAAKREQEYVLPGNTVGGFGTGNCQVSFQRLSI